MMKDKGFKQLLDENPDVRSRSLFDTMFSDSYNKDKFDEFDPKSRDDVEQKKFDRVYSGQTQRQTGQGQPPAQMSRPIAIMLKGRTMAFRKINMNQAPGFKMKRK